MALSGGRETTQRWYGSDGRKSNPEPLPTQPSPHLQSKCWLAGSSAPGLAGMVLTAGVGLCTAEQGTKASYTPVPALPTYPQISAQLRKQRGVRGCTVAGRTQTVTEKGEWGQRQCRLPCVRIGRVPSRSHCPLPPIPQHQASRHIPAVSHTIPPWSPVRAGAVPGPSRSRPRSISSLSQACCTLCSAPQLRQPKLEVQKCRTTGTLQGMFTPAPATQNTELMVSFPPEPCSANPTEFSAEKLSGLCHLAALRRNHTSLCSLGAVQQTRELSKQKHQRRASQSSGSPSPTLAPALCPVSRKERLKSGGKLASPGARSGREQESRALTAPTAAWPRS